MPPRVAIIGGGVAGLTAAHELAGRGLDVSIHEVRGGGVRGLGGKSRSQYFRVGDVEVPGEHGFRFMPAFYRCLPDTMHRIPLDREASPQAFRDPYTASVGSTLVGLNHMALARENFPLLTIHRNVPQPKELGGLAVTLAKAFHSIPPADLRHIGRKLLHYVTRGPIERYHVYEQVTFFDFMEGSRLQPITQRLLQSMPQSLVAMKASEGSARTLLNVLILMMLDFNRPGASEFVLPGPTTDTWLAPWARWLEALGVNFQQGPSERVIRLELQGKRIRRATCAGGHSIEADWFVLATPMEATRRILQRSLDVVDRCEQLSKAASLELSATRWMVGAQFLLKGRDRPWAPGHVAFADSAWGITGISQRQFWNSEHTATLRAAGAAGMLSVIATEWGQPRDAGVPVATRLSRRAIQDELVRQIAKCRDAEQRPMLDPSDVLAFHCDQDIEFGADGPSGNQSPLMIHPPGSWDKRPTSVSDLENLALCGDYVQNAMDLATMEGANATGRQAANRVLDGVGHRATDRAMVITDYQEEHVPSWLRQIGRLNDIQFQRKLEGTGASRLAIPESTVLASTPDPDAQGSEAPPTSTRAALAWLRRAGTRMAARPT